MEQLGLNIHNLIVQVFGFIIVYIILKKFLFTPLREVAEARRREIASQLSAIEVERQQVEAMKKDLEARLQVINEERKEILAREREKALQSAQEILDETRREAERIREKVKRDMELEREKMLLSVREVIAELVVTATEKALRSTLDEAKQRELLSKLIEEIENEGGTQIRKGIS